MADSLNPFLAEDDLIENKIEEESYHPQIMLEEDTSEQSPDAVPESGQITVDNIANKLLKDNFILTALEFHTELVESGRELPRLRDFFSNPSNFERTKLDTSPPGLPRTSSVQTFDSLDFARYSDDGNQQENDKMAVLEFELRKAQETIKSLRATLTRSAETELSSPDNPTDPTGELLETESEKPYEKKALNFLVNEYLLLHNYKLSSVTFAEENEDQDFEDWDDVGLNMPRPPDLLHLYRDYGQHAIPVTDTEEKGCLATIDADELEQKMFELDRQKLEMTTRIKELEDLVKNLSTENLFLADQMKQMEREAEAVRSIKLKSSTPVVSPITTPSKSQPVQREDGDGDSTHEEMCVKPLIEPDVTGADDTPGDSEQQNPDLDNTGATVVNGEINKNVSRRNQREESPLAETLDSMQVEPGSDIPSHNVTETFQTAAEDDTDGLLHSSQNWQSKRRKMFETFQMALLSTSFQVSHDNRIVSEVKKISDSDREKVILMLARCLPHIVPNVLLAKREELIPLIICTATLHPDAKERDSLLNILFNLIKKPDMEQRQMILTGCIAFGQHVGPERVESELLPQCWEQITHKFSERRLLVAEACGALAPYLPNEILSSLVLSMLQQMIDDDKDEEVREAVARSLGLLMGFIDDSDKFSKGSELLNLTLNDPSERVQNAVAQVFLPAFAMWALELGKLEAGLLQSFVDKLEKLVKPSLPGQQSQQPLSSMQIDKQRFSRLCYTLQQLIPVLFASVLMSGPFADKLTTNEEAQVITLSTRFLPPTSELTDLSVIVGSAERLASLVHLYEEYISEEWYEPWDSYNWVSGEFIPQLLNLCNGLDVSNAAVVHSMVQFLYVLSRTFGRTFTASKIRPKFQTVLRVPEDEIDTQVAANQTALTKCTVPVFSAGILGSFGHEEDRKALSSFLKDLLCTLSICQAPLSSVKAAFAELTLDSNYHDLLLAVLWEGVVHSSALVRSASASMFELLIKGVNETLVSTRVVPALVTLSNDPEIYVRVATVPAFGSIIENVTDRSMLDKVYMQFQTFMDDPIYKEQHDLHVIIIKTFARVGPNGEPRFRDEFVLPRLAVLAATNNHLTNETKKMDIALSLFEAYSALSCCFINEQLIQEVMVPGLKCLRSDLQQVAPDHVNVVTSMIKEMEDKLEASKLSERNTGIGSASGGLSQVGQGNKVLNRFKDMKDKAATSNISKIFSKKS